MDLGAEPRERGVHRRLRQHLIDRAIELADDRGGVAAGTISPVKVSATKSGRPSSISVGSSGASELRVSLATPSARSLPARTSGSRPATSPNIIWI